MLKQEEKTRKMFQADFKAKKPNNHTQTGPVEAASSDRGT